MSRFTGHSSVKSVQAYLEISPEYLFKKVEAVQQLQAKKRPPDLITYSSRKRRKISSSSSEETIEEEETTLSQVTRPLPSFLPKGSVFNKCTFNISFPKN